MAKITGFLEHNRKDRQYIDVKQRLKGFQEFTKPLNKTELKNQASRCMDCGIPYCHSGCPVNNIIPDWNNLVYEGDFKKAIEVLHSTNNFPEFTGRICPAPCEASCTLNIVDNPVTIKSIECAIVDNAWKNNWIHPQPPERKTGKRIAVVGSGPAGLAASQQLARAGHAVHLFEKNKKCGGLLRYGIPDFKMEKSHIDRRIEQMAFEGVTFHNNVKIGRDIKMKDMLDDFDAIILSGGAEKPRDLPIEGRNLKGVSLAMDFLPQQNRRVGNEEIKDVEPILATNKHVIVIGGGDTGSDCIGTSLRQGALSVTQLEIMPTPPDKEDKLVTWPNWPLKMRTSSSQEEGANREFSVLTQKFIGSNGFVESLQCVKVNKKFEPINGSEFKLRADLVLLAMGFISPTIDNLTQELKLDRDSRNNILASDLNYKTSHKKVWVAGDMRRGQSLVVWAIREGRQCAHEVDKALMGSSVLPK